MTTHSTHITHTIEPVFNKHSRVLLLGTIPSPKSREVGFFYGHPQNRFWRILAQLFDEPLAETINEKKDLLLRHGIALWDVVESCDIEGASDASIRNAKPNDLTRILSNAPIQAIFTTGNKAGELYRKLCEEKTGLPANVLPSPSSANARMSLNDLTEAYKQALTPYLVERAPLVLDVPYVVELEQAISGAGTSLATLMHRAGRFLGYEVHKLAQHQANCSEDDFQPHNSEVVILCGHGNNGGDGWVAAEYLASFGYRITLISSISAEEITTEPAHTTACEIAAHLANTISESPVHFLINPSYEEVKSAIGKAHIIIDALLGTGFSGASVREPFASWITLANQRKQHNPTTLLIAADVPSGFSAQTGSVARPCFKADHTVTMIALKTGLISKAAETYCGSIRVAPLADTSELLDIP